MYYRESIGNSASACKRDYEKEIESLKEQISSFGKLRSAMGTFIREGHLHFLDHADDKRSFLAIYAGLGFEIDAMEDCRIRLIDEWEREKGR